MSNVLLSADATATRVMIIHTERSTVSSACVRVLSPGLLQSLMTGLPLCDMQRSQSLQNAAERLSGGVSKRGSEVPVLRDHWLPIKKRTDFKIDVSPFKAINGLAPSYLAEMFYSVAANPTLRRNRSADRRDLIMQPLKNMSYAVAAGTSLWNSLPVNLSIAIID